jgi:hypothetical protein
MAPTPEAILVGYANESRSDVPFTLKITICRHLEAIIKGASHLCIEVGPFKMPADVIVVVHLLIVLFILLGVPLVYLGAALHWTWVRSRRWRMLNLGAILFVAAESLLGITCPLTAWEDALRGQRTTAGFIERGIDWIIFYDAPAWVFTAAYIAYAVLVLVTWKLVPPTRQHRARDVR